MKRIRTAIIMVLLWRIGQQPCDGHIGILTLKRTHEERLFILLCFVTEACLFWAALNAATLTRLPTLMYIDLWRLQLDRLVCVVLFALGALFAGSYDLSRIEDPFDAVYYSWAGLLITGVMEIGLAFRSEEHTV